MRSIHPCHILDLCVLANIIRPSKEAGDVDGVEGQEEDKGGRSQIEQP